MTQARRLVPLLIALTLTACERSLPTATPGVNMPGARSSTPVNGPGLGVGGESFFWTDFSEYPVEAPPTEWTQMWDPTSEFEVVVEPQATGGRALQWSATGKSRNRWALVYDGMGELQDQRVHTEFRVRSLGGGASAYYMGAAAVRVSGTAADERGYALFFVIVPSTNARAVVLATWTAGAYTQLASYDLPWEMDTWYGVRLEAEGPNLRARVWPRDGAEPAEWQLTAVHSQYPSGRAGVSHHDNGTVQWGLWEVWAEMPPPPLTPPPPSPDGGFQFQFTDGSAWVHPAGWTETAAPGNSAWQVVADLSVPDGRALRNVATATGRHILRLDAVPDTARDQEVLVRLRLSDSDNRGPGVVVRHTMSGGVETAYAAYLRPDGNQVEIGRFVAGAFGLVGSGAVVNDPGSWYWLRFRVQGTTLQARVWEDGSIEPAGWTVSAVDGTIGTGSVGLFTYEANQVDYDAVSVALGGATAAEPPSAPQSPLVDVRVRPALDSIPAGGSRQFTASGQLANGDSVGLTPAWSATGGTITASGIYTAGAVQGAFTVIGAAGGVADTAEVTIVAPAPPTTWTDGFASAPLGAQPAGWTETSAPSNSAWTVVADATATDGRVLRGTVGGIGRHILRLDAVSSSATTQEILVRVRMGDDDSRGPGVALRHTMSGASETAYVAYLRPGTNTIEIDRFLGGAWKFVREAAFTNDAGAWYWLRFRVEGTTLRVRAWADGSPEPATWLMTATDDGIAAGGVGLYTYEPNTVDFDGVGVSVGAASAPTP